MWLSDGEFVGRPVIAADGQTIGTVSSLLFESSTWAIGALKVKLRREIGERLGASRSLFHAGAVEVSVQAVKSVGDTVLLSTDVEGLRRYLAGEGASVSP